MSDFRWRGQGPEFDLSWAGSRWVLKLDGPRPGLEFSGGDGSESMLILALEGIAARGRSSPWRSEGHRLVKFDCLFDRVEATYAFPDWGDLTVRAGWSLVRELSAVDLEIQILASSVDFLKGLEIEVLTKVGGPDLRDLSVSEYEIAVEPRDRESAGFTYDGRETTESLSGLTTLPVPIDAEGAFDPRVIDAPGLGEEMRYVEFVHPEDVARRFAVPESDQGGSSVGGQWTRYGLFGQDLEKGVVLRSRMRGLWRQGPTSRDELGAMFRAFREQPLPLGP